MYLRLKLIFSFIYFLTPRNKNNIKIYKQSIISDMNDDCVYSIRSFLDKDYISFAPVCKQWAKTWGKTPRNSSFSIYGTEQYLTFALENNIEVHGVMETCIKMNNLDFVKLCRFYGLPWDSKLHTVAAKEGNLEILKWLKIHYREYDWLVSSKAAFYGQIHVLKWLREDLGHPLHLSCEYAAKGNQFETLKWLSHNYKLNSEICYYACLANNMEMLIWCIEQGCILTESCVAACSKNGNLTMLKYLKDIGCPWINWTCRPHFYASLNGHLDVLKWLNDNQCPIYLNEDLCSVSAKGNHIEVLKYLIEDMNCPCDSLTTSALAGTGNLEILKYCIDKGCEKSDFLYKIACVEGNLHIIKWYHEHFDDIVFDELGYLSIRSGNKDILNWISGHFNEWKQHHFEIACESGDLGVVEWLYNKNCPFNSNSCRDACRAGHLHVVKFLKEHGCDLEDVVCETASAYGHLNILRWGVKNGYKLNSKCSYKASLNGRLKVLKFLKEEGCPMDNVCTGAATIGNMEILKWARDHGFSWGLDTSLAAIAKGHYEIFEYCRRHGCLCDKDLYINGYIDLCTYRRQNRIYPYDIFE